MDDSPGRLNIIPDHFQVSTTGEDTQTITSSTQQPKLTIHPGTYFFLEEKETKERVIRELCIDFVSSSDLE